MFNLSNFPGSKVCLACDGCCRFKDESSLWAPYGIKTQKYHDYFICEMFDPVLNKCRDYINRPFDCRAYPFLLHKNRYKFFLALHTECCFVKKIYGTEELTRLIEYMVSFIEKKEVKDFLKDKSDIFISYPEGIRIIHSLSF